MRCSRREFMGWTGAGLAALALPAGATSCPGSRAMPRLGVQLYTLRTLLKDDFPGTLARVAEIGYREVEFAGYYERPATEIRSILDRLSLSAPAAHVGMDQLRTRMDQTLDDAEALGHRYLLVAWLDQKDRSVERLRAIADEFNGFGERLRARGMTFAYHNHDFEFTPEAGILPYDVLLERTSPDLVKFEMDLFWITKGGADPLAYFGRYPGRFPLVHVKDRTSDGRMVDVGAGDIDFAGIFARRREAGIRHYFVEHDEPADPLASVAASYRYLTRAAFMAT